METTTVTKPAAKKPAAKKSTKPAAKKSTTKPVAKKSTAKPVAKKSTKPAAKKSTKPVAKKPTVSSARTAPGIRPAAEAIPAAVAAAPSFLASLVEDLGRFDLKALNVPSIELPEFDLQKAVTDVAALPSRGRTIVTDLAAAAAKRGSEAVSTVNHGVTLVREAVGV